jgi:hypothetical protein
MATARLIIYNSAIPDSVLACNIYQYRYPTTTLNTNTLKDLYGVVTGDIDTWIGTLVATTYDDVAVLVNSTVGTATTAMLTNAQVYALRAKLKTANQGTLLKTVDNVDDVGTSKIGKSGETWTVNAYTDHYAYIYAGTGSGQIAKIASNTATTATIYGTWTTTPDGTSDLKIYDTDLALQQLGYGTPFTIATRTDGAAKMCWDYCYPGVTEPLIVNVLSSSKFGHGLTATSLGAAAINLVGGFTGYDYTGMWAYAHTGTAGKGAYGQIESNTDDVATLVENWHPTTPTVTLDILIVNTFDLVGASLNAYYYALKHLNSCVEGSVKFNNWIRMCDYKGTLNDEYLSFTGQSPKQDLDYFYNTVLAEGKAANEYTNWPA